MEREHTNLMNGGPRKISPFFIPATIVNLAAGHVSIKYNAKGPNEATATACTTSAHAIGDAFRTIQRGDADAMIAGGAEGAITPLSVGGFAAMKALSTRNDDPDHACRPWDKDRDGFVDRRRRRHPDPGRARVRQGTRCQNPRRGRRLRHELRRLPHDRHGARRRRLPSRHGQRAQVADMSPDSIDYVNAHATSTPLGDAMESKAMENVFGERALNHTLLVSSTKSMTGHLLGGAGGLEAGITLMAMQKGIVPPTIESRQRRP